MHSCHAVSGGGSYEATIVKGKVMGDIAPLTVWLVSLRTKLHVASPQHLLAWGRNIPLCCVVLQNKKQRKFEAEEASKVQSNASSVQSYDLLLHLETLLRGGESACHTPLCNNIL